jgi:hypothetical protein
VRLRRFGPARFLGKIGAQRIRGVIIALIWRVRERRCTVANVDKLRSEFRPSRNAGRASLNVATSKLVTSSVAPAWLTAAISGLTANWRLTSRGA